MVDKAKIEAALAKLMDDVEQIEGLIAADSDGKVIVGQTITEMNHEKIAKDCIAIIKSSDVLGKEIDKGKLQDITLTLEDGYAVLVGSDALNLIGLAGKDALTSLALIRRNLINISSSQ